MKTNELLILGVLAIGGYFLLKSGAFDKSFSGVSGGINTPSDLVDLGPSNKIYPSGYKGPVAIRNIQSYGQPGQPSVRFIQNTLHEASQLGASDATKQAAMAARAGAPPRMVAKIKGGQHILDGGKY